MHRFCSIVSRGWTIKTSRDSDYIASRGRRYRSSRSERNARGISCEMAPLAPVSWQKRIWELVQMLAHRLNPCNEDEVGCLILWHDTEESEGERKREGDHVISRELPTQPARESPSVYHIDDSLANVKSLYLPSWDLSFILRVNLPALLAIISQHPRVRPNFPPRLPFSSVAQDSQICIRDQRWLFHGYDSNI